MHRTYLIIGVVLLLMIGSFLLGNYLKYFPFYGLQSNQSSLPPPSATSTSQLVPVGPGPVTAITAGSITIQTAYQQTQTFAISSSTPVWTDVLQGQAGKGIGGVAVGDHVVVYPNKTDPKTAAAIVYVLDPSWGALMGSDPLKIIRGTVTALSGSTATIAPTGGSAPIALTLLPSTVVITNVTTGQTGRAIAVGDSVTLGGVAVAGGKTTAKVIILTHTQ